ncbi:hypothetical protein [Deinococcus aquaticus]|uniref:hypothetical protein n=1 Tax=Deinococcus aquaticus TaxID=328692 RepID=UPI003F464B06
MPGRASAGHWVRSGALIACLCGAVQASCVFGAPVAGSVGAYQYAQDWQVSLQVPVICTGGESVGGVQLSSVGGRLEVGTGRFLGVMRFGASSLAYVIPNAAALRVVGGTLTLPVTVPAGQWGAVTGEYTDDLTLTVIF